MSKVIIFPSSDLSARFKTICSAHCRAAQFLLYEIVNLDEAWMIAMKMGLLSKTKRKKNTNLVPLRQRKFI